MSRFLAIGLLGLIACVGSQSLISEPSSESTPVQEEVAKPALSPEAQQLIAELPHELFNPPRGDVRLMVISDLNGAYGSTDYDPEVDKAITLLPFWSPDVVLCSGDMIAGQNLSLTQPQIEAMWAAFDKHVSEPLRNANIPYGFTLGNHDASSAQSPSQTFLFQQERDLAAAYWQNPEHDPGVEFIEREEFPFYYSFRQDDIFFVVWDGSSSKIPAEKLAKVEAMLASSEAQSAKLRILLGHLPLYGVATGRDKPGEVMDNADQLRALLEKHNVHTYISGHQHAYYPAHRGELQLLHMGIIGSRPRPLIDGNLRPFKAMTVIDVNYDDPELMAYTTYDMGTLELLDYRQLPRFLTGHNGAVYRRDLEWTDLSPEEQARCIQKLDTEKCES
ncbi:MAG: metallophosphoesterase [Cyanobacteria bacterium P01_H01_bin.15]